jgi:drug/metabolite transporter (DMT)-like permease
VARLLVILLVGLGFEAVGVVYLSKGLRQIGEVERVTAAEILRIVGAGATNPNILLGVLFEAVFFATLLVLMSRGAEVSFIWPLTALGFVFTTLAARFILREQVPALRWGGVLLIMAGAALITYSEKKSAPRPGPGPVASSPSATTRQ